MPLRICHVMSADLWAGAEVQLATTASYLVERRDVSVSAVLMNEGRLASELRRLGIAVTVFDETQHNAAAILMRLMRFLGRHRPDVVHTHRYKDSVLGILAAKLAGVPYVVRTVHGPREPMTGWSRIRFGAYEALERAALLSAADLVIAVSNQLADSLHEAGYPDSMVTTIHNGIDLAKVVAARSPGDVKRELGIDAHAPLIGTVGRLTPVKGQLGLLRAIKIVVQQQPDVRLVVVGDGPMAGELEAAAAALGITQSCLFVGARSDVYDLMSAMDVFVLPSLTEGIPMALLEAMALATPVVVTRVGGLPEVIEPRVTGLLVPPGDDRALAAACLELVRDRNRARWMAGQGRRAAEEHFSHRQSGRALVDAYCRVAHAPAAVAARLAVRGGGALKPGVDR